MRVCIGFYQLSTDQAEFQRFLESAGTVFARRHVSVPDPEVPHFGGLEDAFVPDGGVFLLCRECDRARIPIDRYERDGQRWQSISPHDAPVLTFAHEPLDGPVLYQTSVGAILDFVDASTGLRRQKPLDFKRWAKSVVGWIKARCTATCTVFGFEYPCTPAVAEAVNAGKVELRP